jgi:hypothetical protein
MVVPGGSSRQGNIQRGRHLGLKDGKLHPIRHSRELGYSLSQWTGPLTGKFTTFGFFSFNFYKIMLTASTLKVMYI